MVRFLDVVGDTSGKVAPVLFRTLGFTDPRIGPVGGRVNTGKNFYGLERLGLLK